MSRTPDGRRGERGTVMVFFALIITALMTMLALVIDMGNMRSMRRDLQSEVDLAALAAGERMRTFDAVGGCEAAVRYLRINIRDLPGSTSVPCGDLPAPCDDATTGTVSVTDEGTAAPWTVRITYPVADDDIRDPTVSGSGLRQDDGTPCERIGVEATRTTDGYFSGIVGLNQYAAQASAVARRTHDQRTRVPNLWLLDPFECKALEITGSVDPPPPGEPARGKVRVGSDTIGGMVTIDSDGTQSCSSSTTLHIGSNDKSFYLEVFPSHTDPPGEISLFALPPGATTCTGTACSQDDVDTGRVSPQPRGRGQRATRALVDHIYNCLPSYPRYPDKATGISITGCTAGRSPYIDNLKAAIKVGMPAGFQKWSDHGYGCAEPLGVPAEGLAGNWWVDCSTLSINSSTVNFTGGNVIFTGGVQLSGSGRLRVNTANPNGPLREECRSAVTGCLADSSPDAAFMFVAGQLKSTAQAPPGTPVEEQATIDLRKTAVIQEPGDLSLQGQSPPRWTSPKDGPFRNLSLWSESGGSGYKINGGANMVLEGIFFTPFAKPFTITGGGGNTALQAQFISRTLSVSGGGTLWLEPAGVGFIHLPPAAAILIR